jgi:hypothetical protein
LGNDRIKWLIALICRGSSVKRTLLPVVAIVLLGLGGAWSGRIYGWPAMLCGGR